MLGVSSASDPLVNGVGFGASQSLTPDGDGNVEWNAGQARFVTVEAYGDIAIELSRLDNLRAGEEYLIRVVNAFGGAFTAAFDPVFVPQEGDFPDQGANLGDFTDYIFIWDGERMVLRSYAVYYGYYSQPFFASNIGTYPQYTATTPSGIYDAVSNKTFLAWEGSNGTYRLPYVCEYDHATGVYSPAVAAGSVGLITDDHGVPSICLTADGYIVVFYGNHNQDQKWSISNSPRDTSAWTEQTPITGEYTYPCADLVGTTMYLFMRLRNLGASKYPLVRRKITFSGATPTVGSEAIIVDFGTNSRNYQGNHVVVGTKIHISHCFADLDNTYRRDVYDFVYDTTDDSIKNLANTVSVATGSQPISLATSNTSFRIVNQGSAYTNIPCMCSDAAGNLHFVYVQSVTPGTSTEINPGAFPVYHIVWDGAAFSTPYLVGSMKNTYDAYGVTPKSDGGVEVTYVIQGAVSSGRGGDVVKRTRSVGGVWSAEIPVIEAESTYGIGIVVGISNARPRLDRMIGEVAIDLSATGGDNFLTAGGNLRLYGYGQNGIVVKTFAEHANTEAYIARMDVVPTIARAKLLDEFVRFLVDNNLFDKATAWYLNAGHDDQATCCNLISDNYELIPHGGLSFIVDGGWQGNGVDGWLDTGYTPSVAGGLYANSNCHMGVYALSDGTDTSAICGTTSSTGNASYIFNRTTSNVAQIRLNDNGGGPLQSSTVTTGVGKIIARRTSSAQRDIYKGTITGGDGNIASAGGAPTFGVSAGNLCLLRHSNSYHSGRVATWHFGGALNAARNFNMIFNAERRYLKAIGAIS